MIPISFLSTHFYLTKGRGKGSGSCALCTTKL